MASATRRIEALAEVVLGLRRTVEQLTQAFETRLVIEQAKGVLSERYDLSLDDAFALLRYSSRAARVRLHDLAADVVSREGTPAPIMVGFARAAKWRAAAQREVAEAQRETARELRARRASRPAQRPALYAVPPGTDDWICSCGQRYRVTEDARGLRFWPRTGFASYGRHGLDVGSRCLRCGDPLPRVRAARVAPQLDRLK